MSFFWLINHKANQPTSLQQVTLIELAHCLRWLWLYQCSLLFPPHLHKSLGSLLMPIISKINMYTYSEDRLHFLCLGDNMPHPFNWVPSRWSEGTCTKSFNSIARKCLQTYNKQSQRAQVGVHSHLPPYHTVKLSWFTVHDDPRSCSVGWCTVHFIL